MTARTKLLTICVSFVLSIAGLAPVSAARQMQRGAEIDSREPSGWQAYGGAIALIIGIIVLQAALISRLLYEQRRRRYAEAQSRERMSELARANRISTVGELTASIAHEINQPLGAIRTNAETMELMLKYIDEIREIVADIRQDENRATEVIRRLRSLLRKAPFELREIDLNEVVRETIAIALTVGRPVELRSFLTAVPLPIRGDIIQLQQVILNLMMNAMDAMANLSSAERQLTVATARENNFAELSVSDAGPGVPPERLKQIFEPFFTTKAQGMGIGLSIARTIVEAHNGQIFAENQTDGGAIFRIQLPRSQR